MNILILSDIEVGGEWIATQTLIEKLRKKDERLKFYLITLSKNIYLLKESSFEKIIFVKKKSYKKPLKYYREFFYQLISGTKTISKICDKYNFNKIIVTNHILGASYLLSQKKGNYLYFFHNVKNNFRIFFDTFNHYLILQKLIEILVWAMAEKIIIPTVMAKQVIIDHTNFLFKKKGFIVLPNLVRDEFKSKFPITRLQKFKKRLNIQGEKIIFYSGRLISEKGVKNLVDVFLQLLKKYADVTLVIAYPKSTETKFIKKIVFLSKQEKRIILLKNLPTTELAKYYQVVSLAVLPSPFDISPLFFKEALFSNLPIFATNTGDIGETLNKLDSKKAQLFILNNNQVKTLYKKIDSFFKKKIFYEKEFSRLSEKFKSLYNEEKIINNWIKVLKTYET